jgi:ribosome biogenesis GTPase / thiamine phosphate phosphatase
LATRQEQRIAHWINERALRGVVKEAPRNRKEERVRRRDWQPEDLEDPEAWDDIDAPTEERVMPRGASERKRQNSARAQMRLVDPEPTPEDDSLAGLNGAGLPGLQADDEPLAGESMAPEAQVAQEDVVPERLQAQNKDASSQLPAPAVPAQHRIPGMPALAKPGARQGHDGNGAGGHTTTEVVTTERVNAGRGANNVQPAPVPLYQMLAPDEGLVVEVATGLARVENGGQVLLCTMRRSLMSEDTGLTNPVAVGDRVRVTPDGAGRGMIEEVRPRRTVLARPDVFRSHLRQVIAANADQLLVVAAWRNPAFWPELVDRYLVTAALNGLQPIIGVNKIDLAEEWAEARAALHPYIDLGYRVIFTSAVTGQGVPELHAALVGHMTVLAGLSGVGKSSLLSAVQPGLNLRTSEVSDHWHQGRHTTSQAVLHRLHSGGYVVDTPGIREFGLAGLRRHELAAYYPELAALAGRCRFADCTHESEPGCAVQAAIRQGRIAAVRYDSYQKVRATLPL